MFGDLRNDSSQLDFMVSFKKVYDEEKLKEKSVPKGNPNGWCTEGTSQNLLETLFC